MREGTYVNLGGSAGGAQVSSGQPIVNLTLPDTGLAKLHESHSDILWSVVDLERRLSAVETKDTLSLDLKRVLDLLEAFETPIVNKLILPMQPPPTVNVHVDPFPKIWLWASLFASFAPGIALLLYLLIKH